MNLYCLQFKNFATQKFYMPMKFRHILVFLINWFIPEKWLRLLVLRVDSRRSERNLRFLIIS